MNTVKLDKISQLKATGLCLVGLCMIGTGCGSNGQPPQIVTNVQVKTYEQDGDDWVRVTASLNTGNFTVGSINIPITDPSDPSKVYGLLSLTPYLCGKAICPGGADLTVGLNITDAANVQGLDAVLPNGTPLPVAGLGSTKVVAVPVADTGAVIYFAFGPGVALVGSAIPFSALDPAGHYVPGVNIFQPIPAGPVNVIAGMFFGAATKTTGVGLFVDISGVMDMLPKPKVNSLLARSTASSSFSSLFSSSSGRIKSTLKLKTVKPSASQERKVYTKIYQLSQKGLTLRVQ